MSYALARTTSILDTAHAIAKPLWDAFVAKMVLSTKRAQIAQMTRALQMMDASQLAAIGITRSEIPDYASMTIRLHG